MTQCYWQCLDRYLEMKVDNMDYFLKEIGSSKCSASGFRLILAAIGGSRIFSLTLLTLLIYQPLKQGLICVLKASYGIVLKWKTGKNNIRKRFTICLNSNVDFIVTIARPTEKRDNNYHSTLTSALGHGSKANPSKYINQFSQIK